MEYYVRFLGKLDPLKKSQYPIDKGTCDASIVCRETSSRGH
jgi:hypothetical protein